MENIKSGWYDSVELTPQEISEAIQEGKRKKYFRNKNAPYWEQKEREAAEAESHAKLLARNRRLTIKDEKELL